jgi:hypothetical protein
VSRGTRRVRAAADDARQGEPTPALDAEARGDKAEWQRLMKRHLEDIDRSDPNLCLKYAMFLSRGAAIPGA